LGCSGPASRHYQDTAPETQLPFEATGTVSEALATDGGTGGLASTNLQLQVSKNACTASLAQDYFEVTNDSGGPVTLSNITIKYWIYDTSGVTVAPSVPYGGCITQPNGTCVHAVSGVKATATHFSPACGPNANQQANWEITISTTDTTPLATGQTWSNLQTAVNLSNYANFVPGTGTWFSACGAKQPFAPTPNFALYNGGGLVFSSQGITAPSCRAPMGQQVLNNYTLPPASPVVGLAPPSTLVKIEVGLPLRNATALQAIVASASDPTSAAYRQWVAPATFMQTYAPLASDYQQLVTWGQAQGFSVTTFADDLGVAIVGTAAQVEQAFFVNVIQAERPNGTVFYEPDRQPSINLSLPVEGMSGLDNYAVPTPQNTATAPGAALQSSDLRNAYLGVNSACSTLTGAGQTIGLVELNDFTPSDITTYEAMTNLSGVPTVQKQLMPGLSSTFLPLDTVGETPLDIEAAIAVAPGAQVIAFEDASVDGILALMHQYAMMPNQSLNQISSSYYWAYTSHTQSLLLALASNGTSIFKATTDFGAWQPPTVACPPDDLAKIAGDTPYPLTTVLSMSTDMEALPYQTLVGGTRLIPDGMTGYTPGGEAGWLGGGGGVFAPGTGFPGVVIPNYQMGANPNNPTVSGTYRNVPDVSLPGANIFIVYTSCTTSNCTGQTKTTSGTSASAPLWAGFAALMNQYAQGHGANPVGFLNPALYQIGKDPTRYPGAFNDIDDSADGVTTNNVCGFSYSATPGYDLVTGWGTPKCGLITATAQGCLTSCNGVCTNIDSDPNNCGVCGVQCNATGTSCQAGTCLCSGTQVVCNGACVDESSDKNNCGACGEQCAATGSSCQAGTCVCPVPQVACGGACTNIGTDTNNCGACGNVCAASQECISGTCSVPKVTVQLSGITFLNSTTSNFEVCGGPSPPATETLPADVVLTCSPTPNGGTLSTTLVTQSVLLGCGANGVGAWATVNCFGAGVVGDEHVGGSVDLYLSPSCSPGGTLDQTPQEVDFSSPPGSTGTNPAADTGLLPGSTQVTSDVEDCDGFFIFQLFPSCSTDPTCLYNSLKVASVTVTAQ
jgi:hypothetical protein